MEACQLSSGDRDRDSRYPAVIGTRSRGTAAVTGPKQAPVTSWQMPERNLVCWAKIKKIDRN